MFVFAAERVEHVSWADSQTVTNNCGYNNCNDLSLLLRSTK